MADRNCGHSGCDCKVEDGKGIARGDRVYCSNQCANSPSEGSGENCSCGHSQCGK